MNSFLTIHQQNQAIQCHWRRYAGKYRTEDKSETDTTKTKHNPEKANNTKYSRN